ncbi:MAG TPA: hypothetical protein DEA91_03395 [Paenibacillus sp.]|nr:hypothetical protein [Paenibacillus sp.]
MLKHTKPYVRDIQITTIIGERSHFINILYFIVTLLLMLLGILHICITPKIHKSMTQESIWFVSGGLVLISNATINLALFYDRMELNSLYYFCQVNNVLTFIFSVFLVRVLPRLQTKLFKLLMVLETALGFIYVHIG